MDEKSIYWLLQHQTDLPNHEEWFSTREQTILEGMQFPKRRQDWKLGRWTAKQLIHSYLKTIGNQDYHFAELEILPSVDGSPRILIQQKFSRLRISISHREDGGFCALKPGGGEVGCDLEIIEERSDAFISDYFTSEEKSKVSTASAGGKSLIANLIWSAKESALKALRQGLKSDTRSMVVQFSAAKDNEEWNQLEAHSLELRKELFGWWRVKDEFVLTIMADIFTAVPISMENK